MRPLRAWSRAWVIAASNRSEAMSDLKRASIICSKPQITTKLRLLLYVFSQRQVPCELHLIADKRVNLIELDSLDDLNKNPFVISSGKIEGHPTHLSKRLRLRP